MKTLAISQGQFQEAIKTESQFADGIVESRGNGVLTILLLSGELLILRIFEAPVDRMAFKLGEPVAYHHSAGILANSDIWIAAKELIVQ